MSYIEKEKLIKADIASIENRVRHAFNQGYDLGFKDGKNKQSNCSEISKNSPTETLISLDAISREKAIAWAEFYTNAYDAETANESIMTMLKGLMPVTPRESIKPVLEYIKAEIKHKANSGQWSDVVIFGMQKAVAIIDKHMGESEDKE